MDVLAGMVTAILAITVGLKFLRKRARAADESTQPPVEWHQPGEVHTDSHWLLLRSSRPIRFGLVAVSFLVLALLFAQFFATPGPPRDQSSPFLTNAAQTFSVPRPEGWIEHTQFGVYQLGAGEDTELFAGIPASDEYDPFMIVASTPHNFLNGQSRAARVVFEVLVWTSDSMMLEQRTIDLGGSNGQFVIFNQELTTDYPSGLKIAVAIFIRQDTMWQVVCAGSPQFKQELDDCEAALLAFEFTP
jgi:hypothetical protein